MKNRKGINRILSFFIAAVVAISCSFVSAPTTAKAEDDFNISGSTLVSYNGSAKVVKIPGSVKKIGKNAFSGKTAIEEVILPEGVTEIGELAFSYCYNLQKVTFPDTLTKIGEYAFYYCQSMKNVKLPSNCKSMDRYAFAYCINLEKVTLGKGITEIPGYAFYGCEKLVSAAMGSKVKKIGEGAFSYTALTAFTCPKYLTAIEKNAFGMCQNLEIVKFNSRLRLIGEQAFSGTLWRKNLTYDSNGFAIQNKILFDQYYYWGSKITVPSGVKVIAGGALRGNNVSEIELPDTLAAIGPNAFTNCTRLTKISIPDSVKYIGDNAFSGCKKLEDIKLPAKLTYQGRDVLPEKEYTLEKLTDSAAKEIAGFLKNNRSVSVALPLEYQNSWDENVTAFINEMTAKIAKVSGLYCYADGRAACSSVYTSSINGGPMVVYCNLSASSYADSCAASDKIKKNAEVISMSSVTSSAADKVNNALKDNKAIIIKIKSTASKFDSKLESLSSKLKSANKSGVILRTEPRYNSFISGGVKYKCLHVSKNGYCSLYIPAETVKVYNYAVTFLSQVFDKAKKNAYSDSNYGSGFANAKKVLSNAKCMNDLSDAMKVYAVATSGYFRGLKTSHSFNMVYDMNYSYVVNTYEKDSDLLKILIDDKARGVCHDFAVYEMLLWSNLGIENWYNQSDALNHAWSVVKVTNADGKVMWVPFDYDIGPNPYLSGSHFNPNNAEQLAERYKIYLNGVPGASEKKNFSDSDFK